MLRIILLGANGQLGTDIQKVFSTKPEVEITSIFRKNLDVEQSDRISTFLEGLGEFDYLINCTAYHKTDECEELPLKSFTVNTLAVSEMAKFCNRKQKVFFHISTDYVFDGIRSTPYREMDCARPINVYGASKLAGENLIQAYHDRFFIFRVSSLFGMSGISSKGGNFVETMLKIAANGQPLRVIDDQIMSPTHTLDVARVIKEFIMNDIHQYGIYHCSGEGQCSWYEFADEIFRQSGLSPDLSPISHQNFKTQAKRPLFSVLNNTKINRIYQMPYWKDSLQEYLKLKK